MFDQISTQMTRFADTATTNIRNFDTDVDLGIDIRELTDGFTTTSDKVLDAVLETNRRAVDVVVTAADRVNERVELPFGDRFPTPTVAGERYLEFVERAIELNRELNQRVVELLVADRPTASAAKAAERQAAAKTATTKKRTVKKRAAKKATARKAPAKRTTTAKATASA